MSRALKDHIFHPFHRLSDIDAERLAKETIEYLEKRGYTGIGYQRIFDGIKTAYAHPKSDKMQSAISKFPDVRIAWPWEWQPKYAQKILGKDGEKAILFPRRLITTYATKHKPSNFWRGMQEWEKLSFDDKSRGTDTRFIARMIRKEAREILDSAYQQKVNYGLLLTLTTDSATYIPGRGPLIDAEGNIIPHIREPIVVIPKISAEQEEKLAQLCKQFQVPSKDKIKRLLGETD